VNYELLIFDLDGTLIDTRQDITNSTNQMLAHYGLDQKGVDEVTGYVGDGIARLVERCMGDEDVHIDEAILLFKKIYTARLLENTRPYPGVVDLLKQLEMYRKAILTNKTYTLSKTITDGLGLTGYFEIFIGGDTLPRKKPFPDGVNYILEKAGVGREKSLLIGDGRNDILTAAETGLQSVYVSWGFSHDSSMTGLSPDFIINHPYELLAIL
jgi:phosphoglycolate phosphatase